MLGRAVAGDRDDEGQGDRVLAGVVEGRDAGRGEVLGHGERQRARRDARQRHRAEVLLEVPEQGVAHPLVVEHPPGDELAPDRRRRRRRAGAARRRDRAALVDPDRDGVDVEDRQPLAGAVELLAAQPGGGVVEVERTHGRDRAKGAAPVRSRGPAGVNSTGASKAALRAARRSVREHDATGDGDEDDVGQGPADVPAEGRREREDDEAVQVVEHRRTGDERQVAGQPGGERPEHEVEGDAVEQPGDRAVAASRAISARPRSRGSRPAPRPTHAAPSIWKGSHGPTPPVMRADANRVVAPRTKPKPAPKTRPPRTSRKNTVSSPAVPAPTGAAPRRRRRGRRASRSP